jgi:hypothetical protein
MLQPSPPRRARAGAVFPDFDAVNGAGGLAAAVGALLTIVLIVAVLMLITCAAAWAIASSHGNYQSAARARAGVWVSLGAAALAGAGIPWTNFLVDLGRSL